MPLTVREDWLGQVQEDILEPNRRIVDAHHHFFVEGGVFPPYDLDTRRRNGGVHRRCDD